MSKIIDAKHPAGLIGKVYGVPVYANHFVGRPGEAHCCVCCNCPKDNPPEALKTCEKHREG